MVSSMSGPEDHYSVLGVGKTASPGDIKKAFRALAREYHPDIVGNDPNKVARFHRIREAYEVLGDVDKRRKYDLRDKRRTPGRMAGGFHYWSHDKPPGAPKPGQDPMNDLDLDDLFGQAAKTGGFDFGFGGAKKKKRHAGGATAENRSTWGGDATAEPGPDIAMSVDVPRTTARQGGTVTLTYKRLVRTDDGRGLAEYDEIHDLRVPPGTQPGEGLRVPKMGHAGQNGGPYGDLVAQVRLVGPGSRQPTPSPRPEPQTPTGEQDQLVVPISVTEALLGGPIEVDTPQGRVYLRLPPCTSGGSRFRLKAKGLPDARGVASDIVVRLRIVTPALLDDDSRELVEQFARLNPYDPRK